LLILYMASDMLASKLSSNKSNRYNLNRARDIAKSIVVKSPAFLESGPRAFKEGFPLVLNFPYKAAIFYIQLNRNTSSKESVHALETLRASLKVKNRIWRVVGKVFPHFLYSLFFDAKNHFQAHTCKFWMLDES
jgi:hypothetical protein